MQVSTSAQQKLGALREILASFDAAVVCYSGGVDSAFLLAVAADVLGDRVVALTAESASLPRAELEEARVLASSLGVKRHVVLPSHEVEQEEYAKNPPNRCYFCKAELLRLATDYAEEHGIGTLLVGTNTDDLKGHLPGLDASKERGARLPLVEAGLTKAEVRELSQQLGLSTWDKPQLACLASRFPYGTQITTERLGRVERFEAGLAELGFRGVRARFHDPIARLELEPEQLALAIEPERRAAIVALGHELGFRFVTLDLAGYQRGSFDGPILAERKDATS